MQGGASDDIRRLLLQSDGPMQKVTHPPPKPTSSHHIRGWCSNGSEDTMMPQESSGSAVTQHPASKTSLGWINGKL